MFLPCVCVCLFYQSNICQIELLYLNSLPPATKLFDVMEVCWWSVKGDTPLLHSPVCTLPLMMWVCRRVILVEVQFIRSL